MRFDGLLVESWKDMEKWSLVEGLFQSFGISWLTLISGDIRDGKFDKITRLCAKKKILNTYEESFCLIEYIQPKSWKDSRKLLTHFFNSF